MSWAPLDKTVSPTQQEVASSPPPPAPVRSLRRRLSSTLGAGTLALLLLVITACGAATEVSAGGASLYGEAAIDEAVETIGALATTTSHAIPASRKTSSLKVPQNLNFKAIRANKGVRGKHCTPTDLQSCVRMRGPGAHIVLVGDSHARAMIPAMRQLAKRKKMKLSTSIVTSCPWQRNLFNGAKGGGKKAACATQRKHFYQQTLPRMQPDIVLFANLARSHPDWQGKLVNRRGKSGPLHKMQRRATVRTMNTVRKMGAKAIIVSSMIGSEGWDRTGWDPVECLARATYVSECTVTFPSDRPYIDGVYDKLAARRHDVATVDVNRMICPQAPECSPIVKGAVVWRNKNHVTPLVLRKTRKQLWRQLRQTGFIAKNGRAIA